MQQQKKLWNFRDEGGANAATQWYWPPAVGYLISERQQCTSKIKFKSLGDAYLDIFSAKLMYTGAMKAQAMRVPTIRPAVPPFAVLKLVHDHYFSRKCSDQNHAVSAVNWTLATSYLPRLRTLTNT